MRHELSKDISEYKNDSGIGKKVLLIEDDIPLQDLISQILARSGYHVMACRDGAVSLDYLLQNPPDLVIADISVPKFSGIEITRIIRSDQRYSKTPVLMISANTNPEVRKKAFAAGITDFIAKPFDVIDFKEIVQKTIHALETH